MSNEWCSRKNCYNVAVFLWSAFQWVDEVLLGWVEWGKAVSGGLQGCKTSEASGKTFTMPLPVTLPRTVVCYSYFAMMHSWMKLGKVVKSIV